MWSPRGDAADAREMLRAGARRSSSACTISSPKRAVRFWVSPTPPRITRGPPIASRLRRISVYVADDLSGCGIGSALLGDLIVRCERGPWRQMLAVVGDSTNAGSIALHRRFGFELVGTLRSVGFKFGRWIDTPILQRALAPGDV